MRDQEGSTSLEGQEVQDVVATGKIQPTGRDPFSITDKLIGHDIGTRSAWIASCHVCFQAFVMNLVSDNVSVDPETAIQSSGIIMEDETTKKIVESVYDQVRHSLTLLTCTRQST